jgi:catechol-2,3-dioxygenase
LAAPVSRCPIAAEAGIACWQYRTAMCYHVQVENRIASLVVDAADAEQLAQFWAGALGWQVVNRGSYGVSIGAGGGPFEIDFRFVPDGPKLTKNRLHLDVKPVNRDQAAELGRLLAFGARQVDVGQGARNWFVLADPEGNEFACAVPDAVRWNGLDHAACAVLRVVRARERRRKNTPG